MSFAASAEGFSRAVVRASVWLRALTESSWRTAAMAAMIAERATASSNLIVLERARGRSMRSMLVHATSGPANKYAERRQGKGGVLGSRCNASDGISVAAWAFVPWNAKALHPIRAVVEQVIGDICIRACSARAHGTRKRFHVVRCVISAARRPSAEAIAWIRPTKPLAGSL